jgi:hypothetical protein
MTFFIYFQIRDLVSIPSDEKLRVKLVKQGGPCGGKGIGNFA